MECYESHCFLFGSLEWTSSLGFDPQNFTQLPLQPSCIDLWLKVHVKGNIPLLLKVFVRLTSLCRTLYSLTEPCCSVLGYTRVCSMVYGRVKGPANATNNTAVMHNTFGMGKMSLGYISLILDNYISQKKFYRHSCSCKISPNQQQW